MATESSYSGFLIRCYFYQTHVLETLQENYILICIIKLIKLFLVFVLIFLTTLNQIFGCIDHRSVGGLSGLSVPTPCQIECLFSSDCHFVVLVVSSACIIGNFQLTPVYMGYYFPRTVSIFKGKKVF